MPDAQGRPAETGTLVGRGDGMGAVVSAAAYAALQAIVIPPRALILPHLEARPDGADPGYSSVQHARDGSVSLCFADPGFPGCAGFVGLLPEGYDWPRQGVAGALQSGSYIPSEIRDSATARLVEVARPELTPLLMRHLVSGAASTKHTLPSGATLTLQGRAPVVIVAVGA